MKWVKRIIGLLIALQCIGLYGAAINNFNLYLQGWRGPLGKGIFMAILGTLFLAGGGYLIKSTFRIDDEAEYFQKQLKQQRPKTKK